MKIAIASGENHIKSNVDPHFGRCDWYCLYDSVTNTHSFIENPVRYNQEMAGCDAARFLIDSGIKMVVAGRFGSKVIDMFKTGNVQMIIPQSDMSVARIMEMLKQKEVH